MFFGRERRRARLRDASHAATRSASRAAASSSGLTRNISVGPLGADNAGTYSIVAVRLNARKERPGMSSSSTTTRYVPAGNGRSTSGKVNALENVSVVSLLRVAIAAPHRFRFGVVAAADRAFRAKGETGAATAGLAALG